MIKDFDYTFKLICDFLSLSFLKPNTILKKQNPEKISKLLINYNELKVAFDNTKYKNFFKEDQEIL